MFYPGGGYAGFYFWPGVAVVVVVPVQEVHNFDTTIVLSYALVANVDRQLDETVKLVAVRSFEVEAER